MRLDHFREKLVSVVETQLSTIGDLFSCGDLSSNNDDIESQLTCKYPNSDLRVD